MKGCYVYFCDKATESFFRSRIEKEERIIDPEVLMYSDLIKDNKVVSIHDRILSTIDQEDKLKNIYLYTRLRQQLGNLVMVQMFMKKDG